MKIIEQNRPSFSLVSVAITSLITACGANMAERPTTSTLRAASAPVLIEGDEADRVIDALFQSGLRNPNGRLGALKLSVDSISCSAPVVPHPVPTCTLMVQGEQRATPAAAADNLYTVLKAHGFQVPQDLLGINVVVAKAIECQRPTIRGAVSSCTMEAVAQK